MADGMTPAYDAFSQTRDTGTKDRVSERKRVDTYTDPNRYQMPPRRRLGVYADQQNVYVAPSNSGMTKLAESLAAVKPQLMDYFISKQVEQNKKDIEYGIKEAMAQTAFEQGDTEFFDNEWKRFGYEQRKSYMQGEELSRQLQTDVQTKDPAADYDEWYRNWWNDKVEQNPHLATMDPEHLDAFNSGIRPGVAKAKDWHTAKQLELEQTALKDNAIGFIQKDITDNLKQGSILDNNYLNALRRELLVDRFTGEEASEFIIKAIENVVDDPDFDLENTQEILRMLETERGENGEIPSYAATEGEKVNELKKKIAARKSAVIKAEQSRIKDLDSDIQSYKSDNIRSLKNDIGIDPDVVDIALGEKKVREKAKQLENTIDHYKAALKKYTQDVYAGKMTAEQATQQALLEAKQYAHGKGWINEDVIRFNKEQQQKATDEAIWLDSYMTRPGDIYSDDAANAYKLSINGKDPSTVPGLENWNSLSPDTQEQILKDGKTKAAELEKERILAKETAKQNIAKTNADIHEKSNSEQLEEGVKEIKEAEALTQEAQKASYDLDAANAEKDEAARIAREQKERRIEKEKAFKERGWTRQYLIDIQEWHNKDYNPDVYQDWREADRPAYDPNDTGVSVNSAQIQTDILNTLSGYTPPETIGETKPTIEQTQETIKQELKQTAAEVRQREAVNNVRTINDYLIKRNLRPEAVHAILGNIEVETGGTFSHKQLQKGGPGYGLFQFDFMMKHYKDYLKQEGATDSIESQLDFMYETIYGSYENIIGAGNAAQLREIFQNGTTEEITEAFEKLWERPSKPHSDRRKSSALSIKEKYLS